RTHAGRDLVALHLDLFEVAATGMRDHAANSAITHEQVGTPADHEKRNMFLPAKANDSDKSRFGPRLHPILGRAAHAQSGVTRERLVKAHLAGVADNLLQLFGDHEICSNGREPFVNIS